MSIFNINNYLDDWKHARNTVITSLLLSVLYPIIMLICPCWISCCINGFGSCSKNMKGICVKDNKSLKNKQNKQNKQIKMDASINNKMNTTLTSNNSSALNMGRQKTYHNMNTTYTTLNS